MHVLVDTETIKILALEVTDDSVGDSTMFESLLGQVVDTDNATTIDEGRGADPPSASSSDYDNPRYENLLASGISPLASFRPGTPLDPAVPDLLRGDAAYGSRKNIAACARAGVTPGIIHTINVTTSGKGYGDTWGISVRDYMGAKSGCDASGSDGQKGE